MYNSLITIPSIWTLKSLIAQFIVKYIQRKYNLGSQYKQSFSMSHDVDWKKIKHYAELSKLAYTDHKETINDHFKDQVGSTVYINEIKSVRYILITNDDEKTHTIIVRGTNNIKNAFQNLKYDKDWSKRLQCNLHSGFHRVAERIYADLSRLLNPQYTINLTGHSLGGAEAVIIAAYCKHADLLVNEIVTFGQPKIFDRDGIKKWSNLPLTRVINETDIVPLMPPVELIYMFKRYRHFGEMIKLCNDEYYCFLEKHQASGMGVNSFWLNISKENLSLINVSSELGDHSYNGYIENINPKLSGGKELLWKDRERYLDDLKEM